MSGWPLPSQQGTDVAQTKTNRDDGSYATGDLYIPHPKKANVWRYVGRGDDVIVMASTIGPAIRAPVLISALE